MQPLAQLLVTNDRKTPTKAIKLAMQKEQLSLHQNYNHQQNIRWLLNTLVRLEMNTTRSTK